MRSVNGVLLANTVAIQILIGREALTDPSFRDDAQKKMDAILASIDPKHRETLIYARTHFERLLKEPTANGLSEFKSHMSNERPWWKFWRRAE